jgi:hypothetical protein
MDRTQWEFLEIWLDQAREECLRNLQMTAPLVACCISPNGSTCTVRYSSPSAKAELFAERAAASGFVGPMTIVLVDRNNASAAYIIESSDAMSGPIEIWRPDD